VPKIWARAKYRSLGTLLMVKASGGGDYWGEYGKYTHRNEIPGILKDFFLYT
jgi:hypothetical protein